MKNTRSISNHTLLRRPPVSYQVALKSATIEKRHRYTPVVPDRPLACKSLRLPAEAYRPSPADRSYDWSKLVSTKATTEWWSPAVAKMGCPIGDLVMLREVAQTTEFDAVESAWIGDLVAASHQVVFRIDPPAGALAPGRSASPPWLFGLFHWEDSCVVGWPVVEHCMPGSTAKFFELCTEAKYPIVLPMLHVDRVQAYSVTARSWLWQRRTFPNMRDLSPGLRLFSSAGPSPLLEVAATQAFWKLSKTWLVQLAKSQHWNMCDAGSIFEVLFVCIKNALSCNDETAVEMASKRLGQNDLDSLWASSVLDIDDSVYVLDQSDHEKVFNKQAEILRGQADRKAFVSDYSKKKQECSTLRNKGSKTSKAP